MVMIGDFVIHRIENKILAKYLVNSVNAFNIGKTSLLRFGLNIKILFSIFHKLPFRAERKANIW